jgi:hypothetical protein
VTNDREQRVSGGRIINQGLLGDTNQILITPTDRDGECVQTNLMRRAAKRKTHLLERFAFVRSVRL